MAIFLSRQAQRLIHRLALSCMASFNDRYLFPKTTFFYKKEYQMETGSGPTEAGKDENTAVTTWNKV